MIRGICCIGCGSQLGGVRSVLQEGVTGNFACRGKHRVSDSDHAILIVFVAVIGKRGVFAELSYSVIGLAAVSGIIDLGVADTLFMLSLKVIVVAGAVPTTCTYALFNLLFAFMLVGQPPTLHVSPGAILIVAGIWFVSREKKVTAVSRRILLVGSVTVIATAILCSVSTTMMNCAVKDNPQIDTALTINTIRVTATGATFVASTPFL